MDSLWEQYKLEARKMLACTVPHIVPIPFGRQRRKSRRLPAVPARGVRQHGYFNDTNAQAASNEMISPVDTIQAESINRALVVFRKLVPL
jgi:hypothetical protein